MPQDVYGLTSPGGFVFGVQGWVWGEPKPTSITFYLDNTARVSDQYGRPIKGIALTEPSGAIREVRFAAAPASEENLNTRKGLATHAQVVAALAAERIEWQKLPYAGWPQLPYAELKQLATIPPTPVEELRKIAEPQLRKDALRIRREVDEARAKEVSANQEE